MDQNPLEEDVENLGEHRWMLVKEKNGSQTQYPIVMNWFSILYIWLQYTQKKTYVVFA